MQFKLLQFYKVLSNFSTSLISAFISLLIYQQTGEIYLSVLCLVIQTLVNLIFSVALKNWFYKKPQLCLLLRVVPIIASQVLLIFINASPIIIVLACAFFIGLNYALKYTPSEIILAYTTPAQSNAKNIAISRFSEEAGYVLAGVLGGFFLDNLNYIVVIVISLSLYLVSCIPLVIFYINNKKHSSFNTEEVSNAFIHYETKVQDGRGKKVCKKMLFAYFVEYFLISGIDAIYCVFSFLVYINQGSFLLSGILNGIFDSLYGISSILIPKLDDKFDLTIWSATSIIIMGGCSIILGLYAGTILSFVCYELIAVLWPFMTIFVHQRMLMKSKILGISNDATWIKQLGVLSGNIFAFVFGFISVPVIGIVSAVITVVGGVATPINEERTRKILVDYLENNEITNEKQ